MIEVQGILVSDDVVKKQFTCNLSACKGACCINGASGAPLEDEEAGLLEDHYEQIAPFLTDEGRQAIAEKGHYEMDQRNFLKTPLRPDGACAYIAYEGEVLKCGIEQAFEKGQVDFQKPVSCHLYPVRVKALSGTEALNYDRWDICQEACTLGEHLQMPVYRFVKDALVRRYGEDFYAELEEKVNSINGK